MTLIIGNADVQQVLDMPTTMAALEESYKQMITREAVCRPRIDIQIPTDDPDKTYQWGTMEGGSVSGYFAIRMKSDILVQDRSGPVPTEEKYCTRPGLFCGLIWLMDIQNGEPVAILNDGILQHMRVGADGGLGVKYMARQDASVVGMLGSGGMARTHMQAFTCSRPIRRLQVYSPTKANRERFGREMSEAYGIEVRVCDRPEDVYKGAHIVAALTDTTEPVLNGELLEEGTHVVNIGGSGRPDKRTIERVDVSLRFGTAPAPWGLPEFTTPASRLTYVAMDEETARKRMSPDGKSSPRGVVAEDRAVFFADLIAGRKPGRTSDKQITYSERGNLQGAQFWAVASKVYEAAKAKGLGRQIPTEWLLQDIRD